MTGFVPAARRARLAHHPRARAGLPPGGFDLGAQPADVPRSGARIRGWAWPFGRERVDRVEILADGERLGPAALTLRPDIAEALDRPEAALSGFDAVVGFPAAGAVVLGARVYGTDGAEVEIPGHACTVGAAAAPDGGDPVALGDVPAPPVEDADRAGRDRLRRRYGFDPWHVVVLVEDVRWGAGPAVAALDALAEAQPELELVVPLAEGEGEHAALLRRAVALLALEDRVTLPEGADAQVPWRRMADHRLAPGAPAGLRDVIGALRRPGAPAGR